MLYAFDPRARYLTGAPPPFNPRQRYLTGSRRMGRLRGLGGLGDDPTLDPTDFGVPSFDPIGAGTMQPVYEPVEIGVTAPTDYAGPGVISVAQDANYNPITFQPSSIPSTAAGTAAIAAGAVAMNSAGKFINAAGQVVNVPVSASGSLIPGVNNSTLLLLAGGVAFFGLIAGSRGGRR